jgi:hypothetical protein
MQARNHKLNAASKPNAADGPNAVGKPNAADGPNASRNHKLNTVKKFIKTNCHLAPQGSEEWLKTRRQIVGGSELSVLDGSNPFTTIADLVASKCDLVGYMGNVATKWGNLFEELTRITVRMLFLNDISMNEECIWETGSLEGVIPNHRFSPDGLTALLYKKNGVIEALITLLEFKSPLSSIPSGTIPPYYVPQVKAGMCDVDMTEIGLFINNMFRKCSLGQLGFNSEYNLEFHQSDIKKRVHVGLPLAIGIIGIHQTPEQLQKFKKRLQYEQQDSDSDCQSCSSEDEDTSENIENTINWRILNDVIDIGSLNERDTLAILQLVGSKLATVKYFLPNIYINEYQPNVPDELVCVDHDIISFKSFENDSNKFVKSYEKKCKQKDYNLIGVLPWKLFKSDILIVDKDPLYIYRFVDKINFVVGIVADLCTIEDKKERAIRYKDMFPKSRLRI